MAIKRVRIKPPGYTDIVHPETSADVVNFSDGSTVEAHYNDDTRHMTSTNKATLDKITEVAGELKYNGETVVTKTSFTWARLKGAMSWAELIGM